MRGRVEASADIAPQRAAERIAVEIERTVVEPWRRAWTARDAASFARLLAEGSVLPAWASAPRTQRREVDGIRELAWTPSAPGSSAETARFIEGFSRVDSVQLDLLRCAPSADAASLEVRVDLRGITADGERREDRGRLSIDVRRERGAWKITAMRPLGEFESLVAAPQRRPAFEDLTRAAGLEVVPRVDRREAIRRGGYALAASDYDGDGACDLLVGNWGAVQLFRSTRAGFVEVTRAAGLQGETLVKAGAFADLDNDGRPDLVLARFVDSAPGADSDHLDGRDGDGDLVVYRNLGHGRFERKGNVLTRSRRYDRSMPLAISDLDGDGRLDLYVGFPGSRDFTNDLTRSGGRGDLAHEGVWLNRGDWRFLEASAPRHDPRTEGVFPHAALATDLTGDGRPELVVVDDSGHVSPVYRNEGGGNFREATRELGVRVDGWWGMSATAADYDGDGANDLVLTGISLVAGARVASHWDPQGSPPPESLRPLLASLGGPGIRLFHNRGDGSFEDVGTAAGVAWTGEAPAGVEWLDYNNDGLLDLYVANGLWSGGDESADSLFTLLTIDRATRARTVQDLAMSMPGASGPAANPMLSILRDFRGALEAPAAGPISEQPTLSLAGRQRNRLFRNDGGGRFTDVGYLENVDRVEDGYVAAAVDVDRDGRQDLILRNADATPGRPFSPVIYLRNSRTAARSVEVFLRGTTDNADGVGARVTAVVGARRFVREIRSVNGASQSEPSAFFGLGDATRVESIEVRWPSGGTERFSGGGPGRLTLRQGTGTPAASQPRS